MRRTKESAEEDRGCESCFFRQVGVELPFLVIALQIERFRDGICVECMDWLGRKVGSIKNGWIRFEPSRPISEASGASPGGTPPSAFRRARWRVSRGNP